MTVGLSDYSNLRWEGKILSRLRGLYFSAEGRRRGGEGSRGASFGRQL